MTPLRSADKFDVELKVDEADYDRVAEHSWRMFKGRPRARIFVHPIAWDSTLQTIVVDTEIQKHPIQIPLDRFIFKLTPYNNVKIKHPAGGIPSINGDQTECRRLLMRRVVRNPLLPMYYGIKQITSGKWLAYDPRDGFVSEAFSSDVEAARAYDFYSVRTGKRDLKTNFYYNL